jgi:hypothetical protein
LRTSQIAAAVSYRISSPQLPWVRKARKDDPFLGADVDHAEQGVAGYVALQLTVRKRSFIEDHPNVDIRRSHARQMGTR